MDNNYSSSLTSFGDKKPRPEVIDIDSDELNKINMELVKQFKGKR
jgi:hypothetical protein